ncbi:restriction endonuclease subunit S [Fibrobacter sp. UWB3]|uniref:restriction endonuclease subunit S n=1 Tax=Fibrobacter sp. UWB3 TaxID=1964357 RepID=UPI000B52425B|nr:restriction endonuclease subunit S [Fibrobacter sp. UWB3]OWV19269.1 hypothetical protein B7991_08430 [Fibrobacter sp. UWB3]
MTLEKKRFDDFVKLNRGFDLPDSQIVEGEYPVVASTNIKAYHNSYKINGPAVVTGRSGSLGSVQFIEGKCWPLNTSLYVKDFKGNNPRYVYYFLKTMHLEQYNAGAGVPTLNQNHLHSLKINVHDSKDQKEISSILSAYDNLIENNNKRIKILEQMAENLYKEWFVRFRFPGHETIPIENGIPKGWRIDKIENISNVTDGVHNTIQDTPNSPYLLLSCKNIKDGKIQIGENERTIDEKTFFTLRKRTQLSKGDILITSVGTIGDVHLLNQEPSYIEFQRSVAIIKPNKELVNSCYLYETFKSMRKEFENAAHGAAQQCLFIGDINRVKVCLPPFKICQLFEKKVQQIYDLILTLSNQCNNLIKQRDLLLPRLMSGKLAI